MPWIWCASTDAVKQSQLAGGSPLSLGYKVTVLMAFIPMLTGCYASHVPTFGLTSNVSGDLEKSSIPTVTDIANHLTCELYVAMQKRGVTPDSVRPSLPDDNAAIWNQDHLLWQNLVINNFVASVLLTLEVTNAGGVSPSLSFITPFAGSTTTNFTFGIGGQFTGTQDRTFTTSVPLDLSIIARSNMDSEGMITATNGSGVRIPCRGGGRDGVEIKGELGLAEILEDGLHIIDRTADLNVYEGSAPTAEQSIEGQPTGEVKVAPLGGAGAPKSPPTTGGSLGPTNFGSQVQFTLLLTFNAGPNWTLTHFKGPGGGGGGGSGSGSGGGSSNLFNLNRTTIDTLNFSAAATCQTPSLYVPSLQFKANTPLTLNRVITLNPARRLTFAYGSLPAAGTLTLTGTDASGIRLTDVVQIPPNSVGSVSTVKDFSSITDITPGPAPTGKWKATVTLINSTPSHPTNYWQSIATCQPDQSDIRANTITQLQNQNNYNALINGLSQRPSFQ
jgi:hypothetical protein